MEQETATSGDPITDKPADKEAAVNESKVKAESTGKEPTSDSSDKEPASDSSDKEPASDCNGKEPTSDSTSKEPTSDSTSKEPTSDSTGKEPASDSTDDRKQDSKNLGAETQKSEEKQETLASKEEAEPKNLSPPKDVAILQSIQYISKYGLGSDAKILAKQINHADWKSEFGKQTIVLYPITYEDVYGGRLLPYFKKCGEFVTNFSVEKKEDGSESYEGIVLMRFRRSTHIAEYLTELEAHHPDSKVQLGQSFFDEVTEKFKEMETSNRTNTKEPSNVDTRLSKLWSHARVLKSAPHYPVEWALFSSSIPSDTSEDTLWEMFPLAKFIVFTSDEKIAKFTRLYVIFETEEALEKSVADLMASPRLTKPFTLCHLSDAIKPPKFKNKKNQRNTQATPTTSANDQPEATDTPTTPANDKPASTDTPTTPANGKPEATDTQTTPANGKPAPTDAPTKPAIDKPSPTVFDTPSISSTVPKPGKKRNRNKRKAPGSGPPQDPTVAKATADSAVAKAQDNAKSNAPATPKVPSQAGQTGAKASPAIGKATPPKAGAGQSGQAKAGGQSGQAKAGGQAAKADANQTLSKSQMRRQARNLKKGQNVAPLLPTPRPHNPARGQPYPQRKGFQGNRPNFQNPPMQTGDTMMAAGLAILQKQISSLATVVLSNQNQAQQPPPPQPPQQNRPFQNYQQPPKQPKKKRKAKNKAPSLLGDGNVMGPGPAKRFAGSSQVSGMGGAGKQPSNWSNTDYGGYQMQSQAKSSDYNYPQQASWSQSPDNGGSSWNSSSQYSQQGTGTSQYTQGTSQYDQGTSQYSQDGGWDNSSDAQIDSNINSTLFQLSMGTSGKSSGGQQGQAFTNYGASHHQY